MTTTPALSDQQQKALDDILARLKDEPGPLFPILHAIQDTLGYVPEVTVPQIARAINRSRAEIHGVITFYHHFRQHPVGKHMVQVCRAEACQSMGCTDLEAHAKKSLGIDWHGTTADGQISLEAVYCLGNCALSPSIRVNDDIVGRVSKERFDEVIAELRTAQ
ncbi:MAG TPA: formate dehydrogenase subunit gamma [Rhodocyclaceae bacterium]|jgi:formate dehydrogenase subunit gamma|nr:formate dehydrogenase subunit gamma [Rhodocyclaceae bacterium]